MRMETSPSTPRTRRIKSDVRPRGSMKSISAAVPVSVLNVVSRTSVSGR